MTAIEALRGAAVATGFLASTIERANYRRVWTRDAIICGLAGAACGDEELIDGLGATLAHLEAARGPGGLIPSNVAADDPGDASYGSLCGRIDCGAWFTIGTCHYLQVAGASTATDPLVDAARACMALYDVWELNARGLVNVPVGGDWADEFPLSGYVLTEQLLRLWALRSMARVLRDDGAARRARELEQIISRNYVVEADASSEGCYHPVAFARLAARGGCAHFTASLAPPGYDTRFDALANALGILLGVGSEAARDRAAEAGLAASRSAGGELAPAFWPPIDAGDARWPELESLNTHGFRNHAGQYHNGGLWPMVNGFWGAALARSGRTQAAARVLESITAANRTSPSGQAGDDFYEFHGANGGAPGGTPRCSWSAAGEILLAAHLDDQPLDYGADDQP